MTTIETEHGLYLAGPARILEDDRELAWAERSVKHNSTLKYVLGRYVEADKANSNRQMWTLADLKESMGTIVNSPINLLHHPQKVIGHYTDTEMLYPTDSAASAPLNPFVEALGVVYRYYFPDEYKAIEEAHANGRLFFSMECIPKQVSCVGEGGCQETFEYAGRTSDTYCSHLNEGKADKLLVKPHFTAGAILIPPVQPGWKAAEIHSLVSQYAQQAEVAYDGIATEVPTLDASTWEATMLELLAFAALRDKALGPVRTTAAKA